jgi:hypothetical protein
MARVPDEADIQRALVIWLDGNPDASGRPRTTPALLPGVVYWHTPNSGEGRSAFQGKILKQQGVKSGIPDLVFLWGGLRGLELKKPGGVLSPSQKQMHPRLLAAGAVAVATCDSLEGARAVLRSWGLISSGL